ncbi:MAG TPA: FtsX-like permease family protein [Chthoniobacterales bacterium]|jgi:putative ABC transport system permease protein|nr:FtsX-like permease family protein [Chthoniobacterales bacterium]
MPDVTSRFAFIPRMAWRDSRSSRRRLLLFSISISLGVAALIAIGLFRASLGQAIDDQARALLGADLVVESPRPFTPEQEKMLRSLGETQAREVRFRTMALFPKSGGTRLVYVRALGGAFPFYGKMETTPASAAQSFRNGGEAIPEESLLFQFRAQRGDPIKIGQATFTIAGALTKMPGEASPAASFAPRVYIPLQNLAQTNLLKPGSLARYLNFVKFAPGVDVAAEVKKLAPRIEAAGLEYDTVAKRKKDLGRALDNLYRFLNLVGFISLLLGAVGVASAIQAHLQQKMRTAAVLRCLGAAGRTTVAVYLLQAMAMGVIGVLAGAALGLTMHGLLPGTLKKFIPFPLPRAIAWTPVWGGMAVGLAVCILFALPPLLRFRRVSPLLALRATIDEHPASARRDLATWLIYFFIAASLTAFAISQAESWRDGLFVAGGLGLAIALLVAIAKLLIFLVPKVLPQGWSFVLRQGMANLYRPNNRTLLLTLSLGLGTFLLLTIYLTRDVLLTQFRSIDAQNQPNIFLFDIQPDQTKAVAQLVRQEQLPVIQEAPIVTMRLVQVKGRKAADLLKDTERKIPEWELEREYRSTYRADLSETEKITAGKWTGHFDYHPGDPVPVSVEQDIAKDLGLTIGDTLVFDVQGVPIKTWVASLREVDWKRFQTNFFVVFPTGVLENAPTFNVLVSRVPTPAASARLQNAVVAKFPNVSAIDLSSVIQTVDSILSKVALVIRIMSLFTVGTGLIVLGSTIWSGRYQRLKESVLLRTLGASRWQIWKILGAEYLFLGLLASATGIVLAIVASWALAVFAFQLEYTPSFTPMVLAALIGSSLTVMVGLLTSYGVGSTPPLAILREELE